MRRMFPLVLCISLTIVSATMASTAATKAANKDSSIAPAITTSGQAVKAELMCVQTPKEVVFTVNDESNGACLATIVIDPIKSKRIGAVYDGWPDLLGPTAEESVNKYLMDEMKPSGTHDGRLDDAGKADCHLRTIVAPAATPTLSDATPRNINLTYGVNGPNNTTKVADTGDRPRR